MSRVRVAFNEPVRVRPAVRSEYSAPCCAKCGAPILDLPRDGAIDPSLAAYCSTECLTMRPMRPGAIGK